MEEKKKENKKENDQNWTKIDCVLIVQYCCIEFVRFQRQSKACQKLMTRIYYEWENYLVHVYIT